MKLICFVFWFIFNSAVVNPANHGKVLTIDENSVCQIKTLCFDCLRLPQCSWCTTEGKCYSKKLMPDQGYCENASIHHRDYGMSLEENAKCSCANGNLERNCIPPGSPQDEECSGRGKCICGRCFCDSYLDSEHPTKAIMGEYCEFDNFSCDDPKCNEGPYSINEQRLGDEDDLDAETDAQPSEESIQS